MELTSKVRELVQPSIPSPRTTIPLSIIDQVIPRLYFVFFLFFKSFSISSHHLKLSLSKSLSLFYPLAGRFNVLPGQFLEIHCGDDGVEFFEATARESLDEAFPSFHKFNRSIATLVSCDPFSPHGEIESLALLSIQLTRFPCGGACLQVAVHHTAMDGMAAADFVRAWAKFSSGDEESVRPPCVDRSLPQPEDTIPSDFVPAMFQGGSERSILPGSGNADTVIVPFSSCAIRSMLTTKIAATRFEILAAHLWIEVTRARSTLSVVTPQEETRLVFTVDARNRFNHPALPGGFLGNAVFPAIAATTAGTLLERSIDYAVGLIQAAKASQTTHRYMAATVAWLESRESAPLALLGKADFLVSSWQRMELGSIDFGCGKPAFVGSPGLFYPECCVILPQVVGDDQLVVSLRLDGRQLRNMDLNLKTKFGN